MKTETKLSLAQDQTNINALLHPSAIMHNQALCKAKGLVFSLCVLDLDGCAVFGEDGGRNPWLYLYWRQWSTWTTASTPGGIQATANISRNSSYCIQTDKLLVESENFRFLCSNTKTSKLWWASSSPGFSQKFCEYQHVYLLVDIHWWNNRAPILSNWIELNKILEMKLK